jgi:hypothetical protein
MGRWGKGGEEEGGKRGDGGREGRKRGGGWKRC